MTVARAMIHDAWYLRHKAVEDQHEAARIEIKAVEKRSCGSLTA
jgi:hypothetical protein